MLATYPACFFKEGNGYSVVFPDLNYLATCGDTIEEAFSMAIDCLAGYLFSLDKDGEEIPAPSSLQSISIAEVAENIDVDYTDEDFVNIVSVDVEEYARIHFCKSVKKTLSIPEWMNKEALAAGINFSQVLQEALMQKLSAR